MKKWLKFFCLGFFSHNRAKEAAKRGYTNVFLGFVLALIFLWGGFVGGSMLPFGVHYGNSPDFAATVRAVFANADPEKRIEAEIKDGTLKAKNTEGDYSTGLLVNSFEREADKQNYSVNGYNIVVDFSPSDTLAEVEAYCLSNDGKNTEITYEEYLTLSEVARLNFDFKLRYTGRAFVPDDGAVEGYKEYLYGSGEENKNATLTLEKDLSENKITKTEYNRSIYELYFKNYYPEITEYETASTVPLLRNYYYHQYVSRGVGKYLFIFDDYLTGSFETKSGIEISFHGFFGDMKDGAVVPDGATQHDAAAMTDRFIKDSFNSTGILNVYAHTVNVISLIPFIALMIMVATLLSYSLLKLRGVESIGSIGAMFKIVGSFSWFSGVIAALLSLILAFFARPSVINLLPPVLFFLSLAVRSIVFFVKENKLYREQLELQETTTTEV